ncbi:MULTISPECIES: anhydro-N-acetylmuramic acid kinase [Streptomyces]|uniref:anhydro-N-acetylmuramic acid kinase n=1 Tax=Streptomyces TaxID=1883 RepID=UPI0029B02EB0|nr:anhydro-N-acetylmuramic acid kinase [Streptomyces sp. WI03-4A]MDX2592218.1 anhydro-N-acetylmuramic acid kinase [Streptomyces sp. WI03-4A]
MRVIGLMSGTSYDAVDAAAADLRLDGDTLVLRPLGMVSAPYDDGLREALGVALPPASVPLAEVCRLDTRIGQAFAAAARRANRELCAGSAELVASHGQTVYHWADGGRVHGTLQLGQPAWIAEATGLPVVSDFRARDVAAGGQGAPLVSLVDLLWLRGRPGTPVALNIGGIANLTAPDGTAFDTGPGCALLDAAAREYSGGRLAYDAGGELAARGRPHRPLLDRLLAEPYYALRPPKTTGKELFHPGYLRAAGVDGLPAQDVLATLTVLTARTVADAVRSAGATEVVASGGGTRNPVLMSELRRLLAPTGLRTSDELGLPAAAKEAYAFAVLGFLTAHGLPGTDPRATGARRPSVLGSVTPGRDGLPAPRGTGAAPRRLVVTTEADRAEGGEEERGRQRPMSRDR